MEKIVYFAFFFYWKSLLKKITIVLVTLFTILHNYRFLQRNETKTQKKRDTYESINALHECKEMVFNASKGAIFPLPTSKDAGLNKSVPKQMLERVLLNTVKKHCLFTVSSMRKY